MFLFTFDLRRNKVQLFWLIFHLVVCNDGIKDAELISTLWFVKNTRTTIVSKYQTEMPDLTCLSVSTTQASVNTFRAQR